MKYFGTCFRLVFIFTAVVILAMQIGEAANPLDNPTLSIQLNINENNIQSYGLNFGIHPSATKGIDLSLGEIEYPPFPPGGGMPMFRTVDGNTILDLRPYVSPTQADTYRIGIVLDETDHVLFPMTFSWPNLNSYYSGSVRMISNIEGISIDIDMKAQTSYTRNSYPGNPSMKIWYLRIVTTGPLPGTSLPVVSTYGLASGGFQGIVHAPSGGAVSTNSALAGTAGTTTWFEYGPTKLYGTSTIPQIVPDGTSMNVSSQFDPSTLPPNTRIHFRAVAQTNSGTFYGEDQIVSNGIPPPEVPSMQYPSNDAVNLPTTLTLRWNFSTGAETYRLQLSTDSLFGSFIVNDSTLIDTTRQVGPLSNKMKYYWRVNAKNTGGTSPWSEVWKFTTIVAAQSTPNLVSPANGAINQPITLTLKWNTSVDASLYRLQVATNSAFTIIVYDDSTITDTSRQVGPLLNNTLYYWHVQAKNVGGISDWSEAWSFTTIVQIPNQVVLVKPLNGATVNADSVNCVWQKGTPAIVAYWYEKATDSLFTINRIIDSSLIDSSYLTRNLVNGQSYWWRVKAKNAAGWGPFSEKRKFNVDLFVSVNDEKGLPKKFSLEQNYPNPFNPTTTIEFELASEAFVTVKIYNTLGQEIGSLAEKEWYGEGSNDIQFDGTGLPSGVYHYRINAEDIDGKGILYSNVKKMLLVK
ncbi:MAG: T9SS type A sorting domain-containing protein [Bacteroidota bacterium]|nr:T9SS type A sorting domain-containing protein [Bacteroidota bacterium]